MRQLLTYWPPRMVSAKWTFQLSRSSTLAMRRGHAAFGHHRVGFAQQRLADQADGDAAGRRFDCGTQPGAARPDDEDVVRIRVHARPFQGSLKVAADATTERPVWVA